MPECCRFATAFAWGQAGRARFGGGSSVARGAPIPPSSYYPVSPPINWGGVYIGLNGGYGLGNSNWSNSLGSTGNFAANGGVFGGTLGINYAGFGDWVLLGFEGDFDWSGATGSGGCSALGVGHAGSRRNLPNQN